MMLLHILKLLTLASSLVACQSLCCSREEDQGLVYRVAQHICGCTPNSVGALRYYNNRVQFCNGTDYVDLGVAPPRVDTPPKLGTEGNPAMSCRAIIAKNSDAESGLYYIKTGATVTKTYCYMDQICGSKGWTMIMKIDGSKNTFHYRSAYWTNRETYNTNAAAGGLDNQETKLQTYSNTPFRSLCLGMKTGSTLKWLKVNKEASSLYSILASNKYTNTNLGREAWKAIVPGSSLQRNCNREGFNVYTKDAMVRIGIIANQENDCDSPDSRIGFGTGGSNCGQNDKNTAGNEAKCSADNGDKSIKSFGYIFAQKNDMLS